MLPSINAGMLNSLLEKGHFSYSNIEWQRIASNSFQVNQCKCFLFHCQSSASQCAVAVPHRCKLPGNHTVNHWVNIADRCRPLLNVVNNLMSTTLLRFSGMHRLLWAGDVYFRDLFSSSEPEWSGVAGFLISSSVLFPLWVGLCIFQSPLESSLSFIKSSRQHGVQMVHNVIKSRCLEDTISWFISLQANQHSIEYFFVLHKSRDHLTVVQVGQKEPDTRGLVSEQPRRCKKCVNGQRAFRYGVKSADRWWPHEPAEGLFGRKCGRLLWLHHSGSVAPLHAPVLSHPPMLPSLKYLLFVLQDPAQLFFAFLIEKGDLNTLACFAGSLTCVWWEDQEYERIIYLHLVSLI